LLCEKISSAQDFNDAKNKNFDLFQGNFIIEPQIIAIKDVSPLKVNFVELLNKVNKPDINFEDIANIISRDVSLSFKLLKLVNSVAFGLMHKIESIKQASVMLGATELKKWVAFFAINNICDEKPDALMRTSLIRAKFLEKLALTTNLKARSSDLFLTGLFSLLDVMFGRPLEEILLEIQISDDVKDVLLNKKSIFADIFNLSIAYEKCDWDLIDVFASKVGITDEFLIKSYLEATTWCNKIMNETLEILD
jgi:EAL and modified HD-GYP domain-containing signal transduction protein